MNYLFDEAIRSHQRNSLEGAFVEANNEIYLTTDSTKFAIRSGVLYGFGSGRKAWEPKVKQQTGKTILVASVSMLPE